MQKASSTSASTSAPTAAGEREKREKRGVRQAPSSAIIAEARLVAEQHRADIVHTHTTNSQSPDGHSSTILPKHTISARTASREQLRDDSPTRMQHVSEGEVMEQAGSLQPCDRQRSRSSLATSPAARGGSPSHQHASGVPRPGNRGRSPPPGGSRSPRRGGSPPQPRARKPSPRRHRGMSPEVAQVCMEEERRRLAEHTAAERDTRRGARSSKGGSVPGRRSRESARESARSGVPPSIHEGEALPRAVVQRLFCASAPLEDLDAFNAGDSGLELLAPVGAASDFANRVVPRTPTAWRESQTETVSARPLYTPAPPQGASVDERRSFIERQLDALGSGAIVLERFVLLDSGQRCHGGAPSLHPCLASLLLSCQTYSILRFPHTVLSWPVLSSQCRAPAVSSVRAETGVVPSHQSGWDVTR